MKAQPAFV